MSTRRIRRARARAPIANQTARRCLRVETLNARIAPAAVAGFDAATGQLILTGDGGDNTARLSVMPNGSLRVVVDGQVVTTQATARTLTGITFTSGAGTDRLVIGDLHVPRGLAVTGDEVVEVAGQAWAGGPLSVTASDRIEVGRTGWLRSQFGVNGGSVSLTAPVVVQGGRVAADGARGGTV